MNPVEKSSIHIYSLFRGKKGTQEHLLGLRYHIENINSYLIQFHQTVKEKCLGDG